tara:strand:+ start:9256 stop:10452 length:1197 start_codon:yes stop_codon:yes gene_type:complete
VNSSWGQKIKMLVLSALSGVLAGISATLFLFALKWATDYREDHMILIWFLPVAGFFIGWVYYAFGKDVAAGNNLIIDEIHDPKKVIPFRMAPFILMGTVLTHLFGGSAGREGTAVQMGGSLADQLTHFFKVSKEQRKILLAAGSGAGFGAAIGAPLAGAIFGMEMNFVGRFKWFAVLESLVASYVGYATTHVLHAPHTRYLRDLELPFDLHGFFAVFLGGLAFGLMSLIFVRFSHRIENVFRQISFPPLKPLVGGMIVVGLFYVEGSYRYDGLGLDIIQGALTNPSSIWDPFYKMFFSALTVSTGFKGGEFIPMVFMGATLGSALSVWLQVPVSLMASVGFASVFGAASKTPLACSIMAMEVFGWDLAPFALLSCFTAYVVSGPSGIYSSQIKFKKLN